MSVPRSTNPSATQLVRYHGTLYTAIIGYAEAASKIRVAKKHIVETVLQLTTS